MDEENQAPRDGDLFAERIGGIPWIVIAGAALGIAAAYAFVPAAEGAEGALYVILRWSHPVAWLFFAAAAAARARIANAPVDWAAPIAATGGMVYLVYMVTTMNGG